MKLQLNPYRRRLNEIADAISLDIDEVPVNMGAVCDWFGATVVQSKDIDWRNAYLSFDNGRLERPIFTVGLNPQSAYARFCIAHELAHLILAREFNLLPEGRSQYWQHEILCDEFARQLLVPKRYMNDLMLGRPTTGSSLLMRTLDIESEAMITWVHGAKRLADFRASSCFLRLEMVNGTLFKTMGSTLTNHRGRAAEISDKNPLFQKLKDMLDQAAMTGRAKVTLLEPGWFEGKLRFLKEYRQIFAICRRRQSVGKEVLLAADE